MTDPTDDQREAHHAARPRSTDERDDELLAAMWSQTQWRGLSDTQMRHVYSIGIAEGRRLVVTELVALVDELDRKREVSGD